MQKDCIYSKIKISYCHRSKEKIQNNKKKDMKAKQGKTLKV